MGKNLYIYGAGIVAVSIFTAIRHLYKAEPIAFLVSNGEKKVPWIEGIPVLEILEMESLNETMQYLIATPEVHHAEIAENLIRAGAVKEQLIFVDNRLENMLMEAYYSNFQEFKTVRELLDGYKTFKSAANECSLSVFQAKSHLDKPLKNSFSIPEYVKPIQVGADLTEETIAPIRDNSGVNISEKNLNYCELTATYFAWKNSSAQYKGICHYRRIFDISDEQIESLLQKYDVDVILPYPSIHYPDISEQYMRYVRQEDWSAMLQAMKEVAPEYFDAYVEGISKEKYFYNFNMLIARKEIFDDYCKFLFTVLERTEELVTPRGWERADRFAGYLGENLTTIYFRKNKDKLKIVHAGKLWLT